MGITRKSCWLAVLAVIASVNSEKCNSALEGQLLVAEEGRIWRVNPAAQQEEQARQAYAEAESPVKLAYSYARNTLYYSELSTRQVYALQDGAASARLLIPRQAGEWLPWGLALDELNDKLYLLESFASALHVYDLASGDLARSLVIGSNISEPKDVEIDVDAGYLFVLDKHQILRAELDGSNPRPIYQELTSIDQLFQEYPKDLTEAIIGSIEPAPDRGKLYRKPLGIADLSLDPASRRIYWLDTHKRSLQSSDYDGQNLRVHFSDSSHEGRFESLASLAFLSGSVYWADDVGKKLFKISSDHSSQVLLEGIQSQAIAAISCEMQPKTQLNPCSGNRCEQLCLLSSSSSSGYACACHLGLELAFDGKSCHSVQDFILFTQDSYLRGQSLSESRKDVIEPSRFPVGKAALLDVDAHRGKVFYSSLFPHDQLHEIQLKSGQTRVLSPDLLSKNTGDLAYDWTSGNLYYFTYYYADASTLSVTNVNDPTYSKILIRNVPRLVRGLLVHPNRGYVFFARLDDQQQQQQLRGQRQYRASISRMASDGSGLRVILELGYLDSLDALAVDYREGRIYWAETRSRGNVVVRHANLDGQDVRKLDLAASLKGASELAIHGDYIYGISQAEQLLFRVDKREPHKGLVNLVNGQLAGSLSDLKIVSRSLQSTRPDHPCARSHGCQKFCFAVPSNESSSNGELTATCGCPYGQKLADDGISCLDNSEREPAFLPCKFTSFKCNMHTAA